MAAPNKQYDHGLPYPLESMMPAEPPVSTQERRELGLGKEVLYIDHIDKEDDAYAALAYIHTLLLIDDSESMQGCWDEVGDIIRIITPVCAKYDRDGIEIEFVNHRPKGHSLNGRSGYKHIAHLKGRLDMHDNVAGIYHNVKPKGKCRMDKRLASILDPYMTDYENTLTRSGGKKLITPLNVILISDMQWRGDEGCLEAVTRTARRLDVAGAPKYQVGVQFFRVGDAAREMDADTVRLIDDRIWKEMGVRDMVDMTTWTGKPGELSPRGILKVVLGAVRRSIDFMEV
ncbi:hypothetical protein F4859DRAFT_507743 [Xylaria cf. heliscus]|nr:hypothetical protein F4859DRAFT_507743 [Xylaria cf. heliscus]